MNPLMNKIDFVAIIEVKCANANGDPLNGNMPREDYEGYGEISDVCIKRKIRNRLHDTGEEIFVKSNDRIDDGFLSLEKRYKDFFKETEKKSLTEAKIYAASCEKWIDVRSFGQVITFSKPNIGIRGPVSISLAKSVDPIEIRSIQITRSTNGKEVGIGEKSPDTMGSKHFVEYGIYVLKGSMNTFFAQKTGFSDQDAEKIKHALRTLFENDASSARPDGSMVVKNLYWFEHSSKTGDVSSAKVHNSVKVEKKAGVETASRYEDYTIILDKENLPNTVKCTVFDEV